MGIQDVAVPHRADEQISDYELLRIIRFLERLRAPFDLKLQGDGADPHWNAILYLMKSHLMGAPVTMSALASASGVPFASAMRRVHRLIDEGLVEKTSRRPGGKFGYLAPSSELIDSFKSYAIDIKILLADTFGMRKGIERTETYYFGDAHPFEIHPSSPRILQNIGNNNCLNIRFLLHEDNYFHSMRNVWSDFRSNMASRTNFTMMDLNSLHKELFVNSERASSSFDVVCINMPWLGEAVTRGIVQPLDRYLVGSEINPMDFRSDIWSTGRWAGAQYGVPIYCSVGCLVTRKDLLGECNLHGPNNFEKVIDTARRLHQPGRGVHGIVWDAARGMRIAHSFIFFMASCGQPIINIPTARSSLDYSRLSGEMYRPRILSDAGFRALEHMHNLLEFSPPNILQMQGESALAHFESGHAAMIYCWSMRAYQLENDVRSVVKRKLDFLPHPHGPGGQISSPLGGFLLAIPAGISSERAELALETISWMMSPAAMRQHVKNGIPVAPRFSVLSDLPPSSAAPIVRFADKLAQHRMLYTWHRPPIAEYSELEERIGEYIFLALSGEMTDREALVRCQNDADAIMRSHGHY